MLQVLSDDRERGSGPAGGARSEDDSGYSMAFIMDAWTWPSSDGARAQSVDIPVREGECRKRLLVKRVVGPYTMAPQVGLEGS